MVPGGACLITVGAYLGPTVKAKSEQIVFGIIGHLDGA